MMTLFTFDRAPDFAHGLVRDIRIRWALEEAALPYRVESVPFEPRSHLAQQPFGQVPFLRDGDIELFESGAMLLHLGELSERLLPRAAPARAQAISWLFAAFNSVEMETLPWGYFHFNRVQNQADWLAALEQRRDRRLDSMEAVLAGRQWLGEDFSIADIAMSDVLRLAGHLGGLKNHPACRDYVARASARPAFAKAYQDQLAHFTRIAG
ncbi:glutathione S-transferase family protein [Allofranklinella schreckenbergeri]|uniref:Glutathione S-transferase family protein n=1 Tax=Allofranklinella schreckenbergeri TaxID=1076744 RepID=A0A3M6Q2X0_9BURK|nr:glutathione S-transferase family protein [Allofranklinella schreckenbergeri]RMW97573.1 glutathione S-transferase family protein [Allofranklinella schreckenbergeri]